MDAAEKEEKVMSSLRVEKLSAGYGEGTIVNNVSFEAEAGRITVLLGANGVGKSTLIKTIAGIMTEVSGKIYVDDADMKEASAAQRAQSISVMLTRNYVPEYMTCQEVVCAGLYHQSNLFGVISAEDREHVNEIMRMTGVSEHADREYNKLSDGQRQKVILARALVASPKVLVMDEPTGFLDFGRKHEFMSMLKALVRDKNMAVLMSIHDIDLAVKYADKVICMENGGIIGKSGKPEEVLTEEYINQLFAISCL